MTYHAIERAKERYGLDFTFRDINIIIRKINKGKAKLIFVSSNNCYIYRLRYSGILIEVVFSGKNIITFNPTTPRKKRIDKDYLEKQKRLRKKKRK